MVDGEGSVCFHCQARNQVQCANVSVHVSDLAGELNSLWLLKTIYAVGGGV